MSQSPVSGPGSYPAFTPPTVDGFHGVWYGYTDGTYYAGGLGTFPQQIHPMAYHAAKAGERGRTFFVYGGARAGVPGNHTFARQPVHAHDDFYAFWADGDVNAESESALYFTDKLGTAAWRLPQAMSGDFAKPEPAFTPIKEAELG